MSPVWHNDVVTRASRRLLRVGASFVPSWNRSDWLNEWEAELWQLRCGADRPVRLIVFLAGAFAHGMWEFKEEWRMDALIQDFKYALRTLARSPGFTLAAVLMLAVSIGANTALFSVLEEAVLAEPPFLEPDRLVVVETLELEAPKTKMLANRLKELDLNNVLILNEAFDEKVFLAARNLPNVGICDVASVDPVVLIRFEKVLITLPALKLIEERLS